MALRGELTLPLPSLMPPSVCLQAIEKLKLDNEAPPPGVRPKGLGMVSCVGSEYIQFSSALPLENKVRAAAYHQPLPASGAGAGACLSS